MRRSRTSKRESALLPRSDAPEEALFFVVAALCFLAALAALSARSTYGAAASWTADVEGQLTVRLKGVGAVEADAAEALIADVPGVQQARVVPREEVSALLAPWFGTNGLPVGLPLPVLVEVSAAEGAENIAPEIKRALTVAGYTSEVDDHSKWGNDVRRALSTVRLFAFGAVAVLVATAIAVIAFATHAAMLARRDIIDVLHLTGAEDRFIASLFERRFWLLGLRAGSIGALAALGLAALFIFIIGSAGPRAWLLPELHLDLWDFVLLLLTPALAGIAARGAARVTVIRTLAGKL